MACVLRVAVLVAALAGSAGAAVLESPGPESSILFDDGSLAGQGGGAFGDPLGAEACEFCRFSDALPEEPEGLETGPIFWTTVAPGGSRCATNPADCAQAEEEGPVAAPPVAAPPVSIPLPGAAPLLAMALAALAGLRFRIG